MTFISVDELPPVEALARCSICADVAIANAHEVLIRAPHRLGEVHAELVTAELWLRNAKKVFDGVPLMREVRDELLSRRADALAAVEVALATFRPGLPSTPGVALMAIAVARSFSAAFRAGVAGATD
jgi:hypothetical protein